MKQEDIITLELLWCMYEQGYLKGYLGLYKWMIMEDFEKLKKQIKGDDGE